VRGVERKRRREEEVGIEKRLWTNEEMASQMGGKSSYLNSGRSHKVDAIP
jgi:Mor family transcriptional regulator